MAEQLWDIMQDGQTYKVRASSQAEAVQKFQAAGISRPQDESYLKNPDGSFLVSPDGRWVPDPRSSAQQLKSRQVVDTVTDPKKMIPAATEMVFDAAGSIGGAVAGAPLGVGAGATSLVGGAAGAGTGRYLGERVVGTPHEEAWGKSKEAAAWSAAGGAVFEGARLFRGWFKGWSPAFKPEEIRLLKEMRPEYEDVARQIEGVSPRADQLRDWNVTGSDFDQTQVGLVRKVESSLLNPGVADVESRRVAGDYEALYNYLNPTPTADTSYAHQAGQRFERAINKEYQSVVGTVEGELLTAQRRASHAAGRIPGSSDSIPHGVEAAIQLEQMATQEKAAVDEAYANYRRLIGQPDPAFPNTNTYGLGPAEQVQIPSWFKSYAGQVDKASKDPNLTPRQRAAFSSIRQSLFSKDSRVDLAALDDIIYQQGRRVKDLKSTRDPGVQLTRETDLLTHLKDWRAEVAETLSPEINAAYEAAQRAYGDYAERFKSGLVGSLLTPSKDGTLRLSDPTKLITLFNRGSVGDVQQLHQLSNESPALKAEMRKLAFAHYRGKVLDADGAVDLDKHQAYMRPFAEGGYRELTQGFFNDVDWRLIQSAGGYAKTMLDKEKLLKDTVDGWNRLLGGRIKTLDDVSPQRFVSMLFSTEGAHKAMEPQHTAYALNLLKKWDPSALPAYENAVRQSVLDRATDPESGEILLSNLRKMVTRNGTTGANLSVVLGKEYVDRLNRVIGYMERSRNQRILPGPGGGQGGPDLIRDLRRGYVGVLSRQGLYANIAGEWRRQAVQQDIYRALTDPEALKSMERHYARLGAGMAGATMFGLSLRPEDEAND